MHRNEIDKRAETASGMANQTCQKDISSSGFPWTCGALIRDNNDSHSTQIFVCHPS